MLLAYTALQQQNNTILLSAISFLSNFMTGI